MRMGCSCARSVLVSLARARSLRYPCMAVPPDARGLDPALSPPSRSVFLNRRGHEAAVASCRQVQIQVVRCAWPSGGPVPFPAGGGAGAQASAMPAGGEIAGDCAMGMPSNAPVEGNWLVTRLPPPLPPRSNVCRSRDTRPAAAVFSAASAGPSDLRFRLTHTSPRVTGFLVASCGSAASGGISLTHCRDRPARWGGVAWRRAKLIQACGGGGTP